MSKLSKVSDLTRNQFLCSKTSRKDTQAAKIETDSLDDEIEQFYVYDNH